MDHSQLALFLMQVEDLLDDEEQSTSTYLIALAVSQWPNRYVNLPCLHVTGLLQGGLNYFAIHADSQSYEKLTRFDLPCFNHLYEKFEPFWKTRVLARPNEKAKKVRLECRKFMARLV
jgi:hypothetical protein